MIRILMISTVLMIHNLSFSQYEPIPDSNVTWQSTWSDFGFVTRTHHFVPSFNYDTLIESNNYSKVYKSNCDWSLGAYVGAYRSLSNGETFFIPSGSIEEHYLFKHNVSAGDSIIIWKSIDGFSSPFEVDTVTVSSQGYDSGIHTVYVDYGNTASPYGIWKEGIGSSQWGLWTSDIQYFDFVNVSCTGIYDTTGTMFTAVDQCPNCDYDVSLYELNESPLNVFPNPFNDELTINGLNENDILFIDLYQIDGRYLSLVEIENNRSVNLSQISKGEYILKVNLNGRIYSKRVSKL
ncbi:MAG: T9SS type A sorting domain-containing protein [Crocinitomicaceae bacterium]|nr:T9SS type A sorting domain-containing protein [Crocinitomicaceae bacterium]